LPVKRLLPTVLVLMLGLVPSTWAEEDALQKIREHYQKEREQQRERSTTGSARSVQEMIRERQSQSLAPNHRDSRTARENSRIRQEENRSFQFTDSEGVSTFTNIPDKYRHRSGYRQVSVRYQPVQVPAKFQKRTSPSNYKVSDYQELIASSATRYNVDEDLVYAVIRHESNFNPAAISRAGARGLMQLMPGTAADMGVSDIFDPAQNIDGGTQYLARMLSMFGDRWDLALAAYNAGPERVKEHRGIPPFQETRTYVNRVLNEVNKLKGGGSSVRELLLAEAGRQTPRNFSAPSLPVSSTPQYMVHFHSGLTQPADNVEDHDTHYVLEYLKRPYAVRKELVAQIVEPS